MKNKLSWGIALLPFVPSVWMQGQEQKQGIGNRRPNIIFHVFIICCNLSKA